MLALKTFSKSDPDKRPSADVKGKFVPRVGESLSKSDQRIFWRKKLYLKRNIGTFSLVQSKVPICLGHVFADSLGLISYLTAKWKSILFPAIHVLGYTKGYSFRFYGWCLQIWLPLQSEWGKMLVNLVSALLQIGTGLRQLANYWLIHRCKIFFFILSFKSWISNHLSRQEHVLSQNHSLR